MWADRSHNKAHRHQHAQEKVAVFIEISGRSCHIFDDAAAAHSIDSGAMLLPWGNEGDLIDRHDVRFLLDSMSQTSTDKRPLLPSIAEKKEEDLCEEERYRDMFLDIKAKDEEEQRKRERASKEGFHAVGFTYTDDTAPQKNAPASPPASLTESPEDPFVPPFAVLPGMLLPSSAKHHSVIDHTAKFVQKQGEQAEVLLRVKYSNNPNFGFLFLDNPLHPYYKYVRMLISEGVPTEIGQSPSAPAKPTSALGMLAAYDDSDQDQPSQDRPPLPISTPPTSTEQEVVTPPSPALDPEVIKQLENEKKAKRLEKARMLAKLMASSEPADRDDERWRHEKRSRSRSRSPRRSPHRSLARHRSPRSPSRHRGRSRSQSRSPRRERKRSRSRSPQKKRK